MLQAEVTKRIGRNVIAFGALETRLRLLVERTHIEGAINMSSPTNCSQRRILPKRASLGTLMDRLFQNLFTEPDDQPFVVSSRNTAIFRHRLFIEMPDAEQREWKRSIVRLVAERNKLVHNRLEEIYGCSQERLEEIVQALDEQYARVAEHINSFGSLLDQVNVMFQEIAEQLAEGGFSIEETSTSSVA